MKILSKQWKTKPQAEKEKYVYFAQLDKQRFENDKKKKKSDATHQSAL